MEREPIMSKISACSSPLDQMKQGPSTECWNHSILCESDSRVHGVNIKGQIFLGSKVNHLKMFVVEDQLSVKVYQPNILHASVDCIVNAANKNLQHGGGVAKVISKAAGNELDKDGREYVSKYGYIGVGKVCCTTAGRLNYKCVIHAVGPNWREYRPYSKDDVKRCEVDLYNAIFNSLKEANRRHLESIAFPGISSGVYACPWELCFTQYANAIIEYSRIPPEKRSVREIHFVDTNENLVKQMQYSFNALLHGK